MYYLVRIGGQSVAVFSTCQKAEMWVLSHGFKYAAGGMNFFEKEEVYLNATITTQATIEQLPLDPEEAPYV